VSGVGGVPVIVVNLIHEKTVVQKVHDPDWSLSAVGSADLWEEEFLLSHALLFSHMCLPDAPCAHCLILLCPLLWAPPFSRQYLSYWLALLLSPVVSSVFVETYQSNCLPPRKRVLSPSYHPLMLLLWDENPVRGWIPDKTRIQIPQQAVSFFSGLGDSTSVECRHTTSCTIF
jgi:hypothetical protein